MTHFCMEIRGIKGVFFHCQQFGDKLQPEHPDILVTVPCVSIKTNIHKNGVQLAC